MPLLAISPNIKPGGPNPKLSGTHHHPYTKKDPPLQTKHRCSDKQTLNSHGEFAIRIMYWNGGGCMAARLSVNPELQSLLRTEPDIFVYSEALVYTQPKMKLPGYHTFIHTAQRNTCRRGMAIFYLQKYRYFITKDHASKKYDIVWLKLKNERGTTVFCYFYSPGDNRSWEERSGFYDELSQGWRRYKTGVRIFMLGDSNARLGSLSGDANIDGKLTSNNNKPLFLGFIRYTGLTYLNSLFAKGTPTYEIIGRKRSIVDVALTNSIPSIKHFEILPNVLGVNPQTCHKVLELTVSHNAQYSERLPNEKNRTVHKFRFCTKKKLIAIANEVCSRIQDLMMLRPNDKSIYTYSVFTRIFHSCKEKQLGYSKYGTKPSKVSTNIIKLQDNVKYSTAVYNRNSCDKNLLRLQISHKELARQWQHERQQEFIDWLAKLNALHHQQATRSFYAELNSRQMNADYLGPIENDRGKISRGPEECLKNWVNFYTKLYRGPQVKTSLKISNYPQVTKITSETLTTLNGIIIDDEVVQSINTLKDYCSPGADKLLSRDFTILLHDLEGKYYRWHTIWFIREVLNKFWKEETVPANLKETVIRPFLKPNKKNDPYKRENYRPISLLNVLMKIYEQIIKQRLVPVLENIKFFSDAQAAYRKGRSTSDHLVVIQELFYHYRYTKKGPRGGAGRQPLYLAFLDLKKAFDTVPRHLLYAKLKHIGLKGKILNIIIDLYTRNKARIRIGTMISDYFEINSGVMQGSKLGPILFIIFINDLLVKLKNSNLGASIGRITVSTLGFADDIILIADNPENLQKLIDICGTWSRDNGMYYTIDKCKAMILNASSTKAESLHFHLLNEELEIVQSYKYLGIVLSNTRLTSLYTLHISKVLEKAEKRISCIRHFGFDRDGLRPQTSIVMYKKLVRPTLEYAAQVLSYRHYYLNQHRNAPNDNTVHHHLLKLEQFQNRVLKNLINCPKSTPPHLLRLMTGTMPIEARVDILKLRYFWKITHDTNKSTVSQIYEYNRKNLDQYKVGYTREIFEICKKYNRIDIWEGNLINSRAGGNLWTNISPLNEIKRIITQHHFSRDLGKGKQTNSPYSTLYLYGRMQGNYKIENFLNQIGFFKDAQHRSRFLYAFLDTAAYNRKCPKCYNLVKDTLHHMLNDCTKSHQAKTLLELKLNLYNARNALPNYRINRKSDLFQLALGNRLLMKVVCDFLLKTA